MQTPAQEFESIAKSYPTDVVRLLIHQQRRRYSGEPLMSVSPLDKVAGTLEIPFRGPLRRAIRWAMDTPDEVWEQVLRDNYHQ